MKLGAVILAGGEGRRIGGDKPRRQLAGRTLFDHVLGRVLDWEIPIAVSVRDASEASFASGLVLVEDGQGAGPIAGLFSALRHAEAQGWDAVLTVPCDTPLLPADLPAKLASALTPPILAAVPQSGERLHPTSALWSIGAAASLPAYLAQRRSLTGFLEQLNAAVVAWPIEPYDPFLNVNTEEDLAVAEHILKSR